jgi:cytochrome c oxidase cbb3-type subunit 3
MGGPIDEDELRVSTERWGVAGLVLILLLALVFPLYRVYEPARRAEARVVLETDLAFVGADLYEAQCSACHGLDGTGGLAAALATTQFLDSVDNRQIQQLIALGVPGSEMVGYGQDNGGPLTQVQVRSIAVYLRSLEEGAADNPAWRWPMAQQGLTGREVYLMGCARCHGAQLEGTDSGPDLGIGSDAADDSDSRLARRIRDGEDEMPRFGRILEEEQINELIAYLREAQGQES